MMDWFAAYIAFTLLLAGLAWYPCCCVRDCPFCTNVIPETITITMTGFSDGTLCDCDWVNGTVFVVPYESECNWESSGTLNSGIDCNPQGWHVRAFVARYSDTQVRITCIFEIWRVGSGVLMSVHWELVVNNADMDCEGIFTLGFVTSAAESNTCLYLDPTTAQWN